MKLGVLLIAAVAAGQAVAQLAPANKQDLAFSGRIYTDKSFTGAYVVGNGGVRKIHSVLGYRWEVTVPNTQPWTNIDDYFVFDPNTGATVFSEKTGSSSVLTRIASDGTVFKKPSTFAVDSPFTAFDSTGNLYLKFNGTLQKLAPNLGTVWSEPLGDLGGELYRKKLAVDDAGDLYFLGFGRSKPEDPWSAQVTKWRRGTGIIYRTRYHGPFFAPTSPDFEITGIPVDDSGNCYFGITEATGPGAFDLKAWRVVKLDPAGGVQWATRVQMAEQDVLLQFLPRPDGIFLTGTSRFQSEPKNVAAAAKVTETGTIAWALRFPGKDRATGNLHGVNYDGSELIDLFAATPSRTFTTLARISSDGTSLWPTNYVPAGLAGASHFSVALDSEESIFIASLVNGTPYYFKYYQVPIAVGDSLVCVQNSLIRAPLWELTLNDRAQNQAIPEVVSQPANGSVVITLDWQGSYYKFTPSRDFEGTTSFTYRLVREPTNQVGPPAQVIVKVENRLRRIYTGSSSVVGGTSTRAIVELTGPTNNAKTFQLSSDPALVVPSSISIPAGARLGEFLVSSKPVDADTQAQVYIQSVGQNDGVTVVVKTATLKSFTISPTTVKGGNNVSGTLLLTGKAGPSGKIINVTDNSSAITTPATVTVQPGNASALFTIGTAKVSVNATRQVTATMGSVTQTVNLTLTP